MIGIGKVLAGRYEINGFIGEGGMSRVWRALDQNTGRTVAVKVLREEYSEDENFIRRFDREAQAASRMSHPNIVNLLDVGVDEDGVRYLVIEYVQGNTLKRLIQESGALRPEIAAQIIIRVLAALQHAHQNGVIHRDIKPQNILIDKDGTVKVADFGIARVANAQTVNQTDESVMGSVYYFSPEQARGAAADARSDIYSVGVVFYEMLTGNVPFSGDTPVAIAFKHLKDIPPSPAQVNPAVSSALDFVVMHAMEKRPRRRYQSAEEMLRDVRLALEHPDTILAAREEAKLREKEERERERHNRLVRRRVRVMRAILVVSFSVVFMAAVLTAAYVIVRHVFEDRSELVEVPGVIGYLKEDAITALIAAGIEPSVVYDEYPLVKENIVADQSVAPGTRIRQGEYVTITVSRSAYETTVPTVTGVPLSEAQELITNAGLVVNEIETQPSEAASMIVIQQIPSGGTNANRGDAVKLIVSGGIVVMPNLLGMTRAEAEQTLIAYGLTLSAVYEEAVVDSSQVGYVASQTPSAYTEILPGSAVSFTIGKASPSMCSALIEVDLTELPDGGTVTVDVVDENGEEQRQYTETFDKDQTTAVVVLYREEAGEMEYVIRFNGEEVKRGVAVFTQ